MLSLMWKVDLDLNKRSRSWDKLRLAWQVKVGCEKHTKEHSSGFQSCQPSSYRWLKTIRYGIWLQRNKDIDIVTFKDKIDSNTEKILHDYKSSSVQKDMITKTQMDVWGRQCDIQNIKEIQTWVDAQRRHGNTWCWMVNATSDISMIPLGWSILHACIS